jgi:hypothetical protein
MNHCKLIRKQLIIVVVITRDTAAKEAIGPRINGACTVEEVKKGGTAQSFQQRK